MLQRLICAGLLAAAALPAAAQVRQIPAEDFFRHAQFTEVELSPTGTYLAVTVPEGDRTLLAVLRTKDKGVVSKWDFGDQRHAVQVDWLNDERFLVRVAKRTGSLDFMVGEPDLLFSNADGTQRREVPLGGTYQVVDLLPRDPKSILVSRTVERSNLFRMDIYTGRLSKVAVSPMEFGQFAIDHEGKVRYAFGSPKDGRTMQTHRYNGPNDWTLIHQDDALTGGMRIPFGFSADNQRIFMATATATSPRGVVEYDPSSGAERELFRHEFVDAGGAIWNAAGTELLGVSFMPDLPRKAYFDPEHPEARWLISLDRAFPDHHVEITSRTRDGRYALARVSSDVDPGQAFLLDTESGQATFMLASRDWIKPADMAPMRPVEITARDGLVLRGYLTVPRDSDGKDLPLVLNVHGGPHGPRDEWGFNPEVQFLANRGYAVLQVNYRGSGGYGQAFQAAGYRQWGTTMQDDLTDSVRWAFDQGITRPGKVCIYGGSYGGYAALMSIVREPDLYACSIGYVGVYSLPLMHKDGDIPERESGRNYLKRVLPESEAEQRAQSAAYNVERIKTPLMLVHGAKDLRVPISQYHFLVKQLAAAGKAPEDTVVEKKEGHGFYDVKNRVNLYTRMQAFLDRHIGPGAKLASH